MNGTYGCVTCKATFILIIQIIGSIVRYAHYQSSQQCGLVGQATRPDFDRHKRIICSTLLMDLSSLAA